MDARLELVETKGDDSMMWFCASLTEPCRPASVRGLSASGPALVADLDRDGWDDLVAAGADGNLAFMDLTSAENDRVQLRAQCHQPGTPLALGDLDRDGRLDVIVSEDEQLAWIGAPAAQCTAAQPVVALRDALGYVEPVLTAAVDMNADGKLDVVTVARDVQVVLQSATSEVNFEPSRRFAAPPPGSGSYRHGAVADIDRDGLPDVVVVDAEGAIRWLRNDAAAPGTLVEEDQAVGSPGFKARFVSVGDIDGDGWLDLLAQGDGATEVLLHHPAFPARFTLAYRTAGGNPSSVTVGDLLDMDDDGALDLLFPLSGVGTFFIPGR
jgi:FG-GAP-like repeat